MNIKLTTYDEFVEQAHLTGISLSMFYNIKEAYDDKRLEEGLTDEEENEFRKIEDYYYNMLQTSFDEQYRTLVG